MGKKPRNVLIVSFGDTHCNSRLGLCPPEGVRFDEGGRYTPSPGQLWLWEKVWLPMWERAAELRREYDARGIVVVNGDAADFHAKGALIHPNSADVLEYVSHRTFQSVKDFHPEKTFMIRGTPSHVGEEANAEESIAKWLNTEPDPETETWTSHQRFLDVYGTVFHFAHHGKVGGRHHTMQSHAANIAVDISNRFREAHYPIPDVAVRSHKHELADSGRSMTRKTRYIVLPPLQLKTGFAFKVVPDNPPGFGCLCFLVRPDGDYTEKPFVVYPDPPAMERIA